MAKMHFRKTLLAGALLAASASVSAELTGNVALTTDYVWRGYSQTNEDPAIQGGLDWSSDSGVYLGTWASNVDFGDVENMELDLYGGWAGDFGQIGVDVGLIRYSYFADDNDIDFTEAYLGASFGMFSAKASFQIDGADIGNYYEAGADIPLGEDFTLALHVGKYDYDTGDDPTDFSVGVSTEVAGLGLDATYYDSDEDVYGSLGGGRFVVTVSKSM